VAGRASGGRRYSAARYVAEGGLIAAVYGVASVLAIQAQSIFAFGLVQFRISEALTVVALFTPAAIPGLWLGAVLANASTGAPLAWLDMLFGGLGTLLGAWWTWHFRSRRPLALLGPVLCNALIVPAYLPILLQAMGLMELYRIPSLGLDLSASWPLAYVFGVVTVGIGQAVIVYGLGWPLATALERSGIARTW
jgi:uncharacterized membrane protein